MHSMSYLSLYVIFEKNNNFWCFTITNNFLIIKIMIAGTYCCILGVAKKTTGLPEIEAIKCIDLTSQPHMRTAWEADVREAGLVLEGKFVFKI